MFISREHKHLNTKKSKKKQICKYIIKWYKHRNLVSNMSMAFLFHVFFYPNTVFHQNISKLLWQIFLNFAKRWNKLTCSSEKPLSAKVNPANCCLLSDFCFCWDLRDRFHRKQLWLLYERVLLITISFCQNIFSVQYSKVM